MSAKYICETGCKVKVGGVYYSGNDVIPVGGDNGLSNDDVEKLLERKFVRKVELNEPGAARTDKTKEPAKTELLEKAKELNIENADGMTKAELQQAIMAAQV